ncbi:MAG: hypothetical protein ACNS60_01765 [Candidatus Cyclobacteriaceae bacterium M2_1C_046]
MKHLPFLFLIILFISCRSTSKNGDQQSTKMLLKEWRVSPQESNEQELILRTSDFDFPLSRQYEQYIFKADNLLILNTLGPADEPVTKEGRWEWVDENILKLTIENDKALLWKIEQLDENILKVTRQ